MLSPWRHPANGALEPNRFGSLPGWVKVVEPAPRHGRGDPPLYVLSQRGPLTFDYGDADADHPRDGASFGGALRATQASGGLATALGALSRSQRFCWVAAAMSQGDQAVAKRGLAWPIGLSELRMVSLPKPVLRQFSTFSCHSLVYQCRPRCENEFDATPTRAAP